MTTIKTPLNLSGWTALTETVTGLELIWRVQDEGDNMPDVYPTKDDVYKSIASDQIEQLTQFIDGERESDTVDWNCQHTPAYLELINGTIIVWEDEKKEEQVLKLSYSEWAENL